MLARQRPMVFEELNVGIMIDSIGMAKAFLHRILGNCTADSSVAILIRIREIDDAREKTVACPDIMPLRVYATYR